MSQQSSIPLLAIHGASPSVNPPLSAFTSIGEKEKKAVIDLLNRNAILSGFHGSPRPTFFGGDEVQALEQEWSARFHIAHSISMNSATSGLLAAMGAIGIGPGDEVIVPPTTMSATALAPLIYGGIPVFADIDPDYFCLSAASVEKVLTPATKAIIAVNLFGHPADLHNLRALADKHGLYLMEDNAQAVLAEENGKLAGTIGHIGIYSLNIHKHIQVGEGGICVTNDPQLAQKLQLIRNHGENVVEWLDQSDLTNMIGFNYRMTELTAAMARVQLSRVDELVERVETICTAFTQGLSDLAGITPPKVRHGCRHNYYMWSVQFDAAKVGTTRDKFSAALNAEGFPNAVGYVRPLYHLPLFQKQMAIGPKGFPFTAAKTHPTYGAGTCPTAEKMYTEAILQFQPVSWDISPDQTQMLIKAFRKVHENAHSL